MIAAVLGFFGYQKVDGNEVVVSKPWLIQTVKAINDFDQHPKQVSYSKNAGQCIGTIRAALLTMCWRMEGCPPIPRTQFNIRYFLDKLTGYDEVRQWLK